MKTKEEIGADINEAGQNQEFYQTKFKNALLEDYWTRKYQEAKKAYAAIVAKESVAEIIPDRV